MRLILTIKYPHTDQFLRKLHNEKKLPFLGSNLFREGGKKKESFYHFRYILNNLVPDWDQNFSNTNGWRSRETEGPAQQHGSWRIATWIIFNATTAASIRSDRKTRCTAVASNESWIFCQPRVEHVARAILHAHSTVRFLIGDPSR